MVSPDRIDPDTGIDVAIGQRTVEDINLLIQANIALELIPPRNTFSLCDVAIGAAVDFKILGISRSWARRRFRSRRAPRSVPGRWGSCRTRAV